MKYFWALCVILLGTLGAGKAEAAVFTPGASLFADERDAIWDFAEQKVWEEPGEGEREKVVEFSFENGLPAEISIQGEVEVVDGMARLNSPSAPRALVENSLQWAVNLEDSAKVWLEIEYRVWSEETERGFDDPVWVAFQNDEVVYRESVLEACPVEERVAEVCVWRTGQWYVGEGSGVRSFSVFAGDTGDLEKPSGIDVRKITVWRNVLKEESVANQDEAKKIEKNEVASQGNSSAGVPSAESISERYNETAQGTRAGASEQGEVLGATHSPQQSAEEEETPRSSWAHWALWGLAVLSIGSGIYLWRKARAM